MTTLRDAYQEQCKGLLVGGVDAIIVETSQDLLQTKASIIGAKRAMAAEGRDVPIIASLNGSTPAAWVSIAHDVEAAGADAIELNLYRVPADLHERWIDGRFRAARFEDGRRSEPAMVSMYFNGEKVHVNQPINQVWGGPNSAVDGGNDKGKGITDTKEGLKLQIKEQFFLTK